MQKVDWQNEYTKYMYDNFWHPKAPIGLQPSFNICHSHPQPKEEGKLKKKQKPEKKQLGLKSPPPIQ